MGSSSFFHSSLAYYTRHVKSSKTGRTRIEKSNYFYSIAEEEAFLLEEADDDMHQKIAQVCEQEGS